MNATNERSPWRLKVHEVIFEADTPAGKWFDVLLIVAILTSVLLVMLDSVDSIQKYTADSYWPENGFLRFYLPSNMFYACRVSGDPVPMPPVSTVL